MYQDEDANQAPNLEEAFRDLGHTGHDYDGLRMDPARFGISVTWEPYLRPARGWVS